MDRLGRSFDLEERADRGLVHVDLDVPVVGLAFVNADNNQHAANENLRLANLWQGIDVYAGVLAGLDW